MTEKTNGAARPAGVRCAIYTRKSTEEGLDQAFNSLDAQREAAEAYVASQRHEGWTLAPERYDDGGFSGGTMERPALKRLLADIEAGKVDAVVVYKVDRLSRSLLDFARIIETFERSGVSFVSVTQQFNTATSLGRLVLNILLSFAQFEREMIAERTKDKMAAARRKGKWVGGRPPLGYDVDARGGRLVINPEEAEQVRAIFRLYLQERSLMRVTELLNGRAWRMKTWLTRTGKRREGGRWDKSAVQRLLTNVAYVGKVKYDGVVYPGEHEAILDEETFQRAAAILDSGRQDRRGSYRNAHGFLLRGLVRCTACGSAMTSSTSAPRGKPYRYYTCTAVNRRGRVECPVRSVPAQTLEAFVVSRIQDMGRNPALARSVAAAVAADRERDVPALTREQRQLSVEHERLREEARQLLGTLAAQRGGEGRLLTERLAELDARAGEIDGRLREISEALSGITRAVIREQDIVEALALFVPVWDALTTRERARMLHLLIESVEYDGVRGEVAIVFRPPGVASLAREAAGTVKAAEIA